MNTIITEINKLSNQSVVLEQLIKSNKDYSFDSSNYFKILKFIKEKVESKLFEILPHSQRSKRGLINGIGSIFKSITGNLDYSDGELYDKLIRDLQNNQINLAKTAKEQNTLSVALINKFNSTIQQIQHNEKLLGSRIQQISLFVEKQTQRENAVIIKDVANQLINMFEILNSILQDLENSVSFARLQLMHPSIIKISDLYAELKDLQNLVGKDQMPIELTIENTFVLTKFIKISSYILNNKLTYILHIPITHPQNFEYYHLFSVPILSEGQFHAIIPRKKYLLQNELYYAYTSNACQDATPKQVICPSLSIKEAAADSPCEVQLIAMKNTSACEKTPTKIKKNFFKPIGNSNIWIGIIASTETVKLNCQSQEEVQRLDRATYLFEIPTNCQLISSEEVVANIRFTSQNQPILFPDLDTTINKKSVSDITIRLEEINLDDLQSIKSQIIENQPVLNDLGIPAYAPSIWTILIYALLAVGAVYLCLKKIQFRKRSHQGEERKKDVDFETVQLPR